MLTVLRGRIRGWAGREWGKIDTNFTLTDTSVKYMKKFTFFPIIEFCFSLSYSP